MQNVTNPDAGTPRPDGLRGPLEHERRAQIVAAANQHFRAHGYGRTSVADLARAIGFSTAYIYKFFDSKRAIGEATCASSLARTDCKLWDIARSDRSAEARLGAIYKAMVDEIKAMCFAERQLLDIVRVAVDEKWSAVETHIDQVLAIIRLIVVDGREAGEFERKTPLDETCQAIFQTMIPFFYPALVESELDTVDESAGMVARLVLRSLAP